MNWYNWQARKDHLKKEAALNGEWWIIDGFAQFADGDVGDLNHEAAAIMQARGSILSDFGSIEEAEFVDWDEVKAKIIKEALEGAEPNKRERMQHDLEGDDPEEVFWNLCMDQGVEQFIYDIAEERGDVRALAMQHWGHKRMVRNIVETYTLTQNDLESITSGIENAYGYDLETAEEQGRDTTFTIEVDATRSLYEDVPISILEQNNVSALSPYRVRY